MSTAAPAISAEIVTDRLKVLRARIVEAGGTERVRIVAVTKGFGPDAVAAALRAGLHEIGENYADELVAKAEASRGQTATPTSPRWHFLGGIQRNKVARLAPFVALWHGVDRVEEGVAIARHQPGAAVLVEVDTTGASGRGGVPPGAVGELVDALVDLGLDVAGCMTVAPRDDATAARRCFATVAALVADLGLREASMGMSDDLEPAVAEGSTMVRIGTALFGPRPARLQVSQ